MKARLMAAALAISALSLGACDVGVDSYEDFHSAVESGAPCGELFDQRSNFSDKAMLDRIDADLEEIGCEDRQSVRTDS